MTVQRLGTFELGVLLAVTRLGEAAYGVAIHRDLAARTGQDRSVAAVYTTLQRLEEKGLLASRAAPPRPMRGGRARRYFMLTAAGTHAIRQARQHSALVWADVCIGDPESA